MTAAQSLARKVRPSEVLLNMKPWRRLGLVIWDTWRMQTIGLYRIGNSRQLPTPDGDFLEAHKRSWGPTRSDMLPRWLALIGEELD
ncbi:uncharacterized protein BJX67DRAFT_342269 [Aspergillus lucknowensis]|uniref:Uncharacterized protein n=1 Tax=Aspergillus lucknowensis TaxID=176173 RepID=A0ABR4M4F7_9EURO